MPFGLKKQEHHLPEINGWSILKSNRQNLEVYIDDMTVKTSEGEIHFIDLEDILKSLRRYNMRLNPSKFSFSVRSSKLVGFMLTRRGIEAKPDKFQAIINMRIHSSVNKVNN